MSDRPDIEGLRALVEAMSPRPWSIQRDDFYGNECVVDEASQAVLYAQEPEDIARDDGEAGLVWSVSDRDGTLAIVNAASALLDHIARLEAALGEALSVIDECVESESRAARMYQGGVCPHRAEDVADGLRSLLPATKETAP